MIGLVRRATFTTINIIYVDHIAGVQEVVRSVIAVRTNLEKSFESVGNVRVIVIVE